MASGKKWTLMSSDMKKFEVDEAVAMACQTIKSMAEDGCADGVIPLPNVSGVILSKVIQYCEKHANPEHQTPSGNTKLRQWDADFVNVDQTTLYNLLMAANFLNIQSLLDLSCQRIADVIKEKTPKEIRKTFNIQNDFSPDEEAEMLKDYQWVEF